MTIINGVLEILTHDIFLEVAIIFVVCQIIKLFTKSYAHKRIYWRGIGEDGGMPSSHTTAVVALAMGVGLAEGFATPIFFVSGVLAILIMRDAIGVRHNVDKLTEKMNAVIKSDKLKVKSLDMVSGHTLPEVIAGFFLGLIGVLILHFWIL